MKRNKNQGKTMLHPALANQCKISERKSAAADFPYFTIDCQFPQPNARRFARPARMSADYRSVG
ncbi:hypothetical protein GF340_04235 [Candidatus Peregrinibacteria bacterium]|nr:hypothetical protein [Candidatus Peregrinibacteria bacterium]